MDAMEISRSGLDVEWRRLEVIAQNLANMNTTRTGDGGSYLPVRLVSGPAETFQQTLDNVQARTGPAASMKGVRVFGIEQMDGGTRQAYEPDHPHADTDGFVTYPNISHASEMTLMIKAARAYEANLVAMSAAQQMYSSALQIGRQS